jgi:hypothetical protein
MACFDIWEIKLPIKVPMAPSRIITTTKTDNPRFPIFRSNASTLDNKTVLNKKAKTNMRTTWDIKGHIIDKNQRAMRPIIIR